MYRYSNIKFNSLMTTFGVVRVGTLHDFRNSEHKQGIADPQEGKKSVIHYIDKETISIGDKFSKSARAAEEFNIISGSGNVNFENVTFSKTINSPDFFILCSAHECSENVMKEFEGANSCIEINNPNGFYSELTVLLNSITPVTFLGVHKVSYQVREEDWDGQSWGTHPALIKDLEFKKQTELRAIWAPRYSQAIEPQIIGSIKLAETCRKVEI